MLPDGMTIVFPALDPMVTSAHLFFFLGANVQLLRPLLQSHWRTQLFTCSDSSSSMKRWSSDKSNFYLLFLFFIIILFAWRPEFGLLPLPVWKTNFNIMPVPEIRLAICTIFSPEADSDNEEVVQQLKPNCIPLCAKALTGPVTARSLSTMRCTLEEASLNGCEHVCRTRPLQPYVLFVIFIILFFCCVSVYY